MSACLVESRDRHRPRRPRLHRDHRSAGDRRIIDTVAAPDIIGDDPLAHERDLGQALLDADAARPDRLRRACAGGHRRRAVGHQGQAFQASRSGGCLGGARDRVPVYVTFGFDFFDRDQLAEAAKLWVKRGFSRLKMTVGNNGLQRRDKKPLLDLIREDEARVRGGARGGRAGRRAFRRRQLQPRPLSRAESSPS